jgi:hypothetical protein
VTSGRGTVAGLGSIFLFATGRRGKGDAPLPPTGHETISPVQTT